MNTISGNNAQPSLPSHVNSCEITLTLDNNKNNPTQNNEPVNNRNINFGGNAGTPLNNEATTNTDNNNSNSAQISQTIMQLMQMMMQMMQSLLQSSQNNHDHTGGVDGGVQPPSSGDAGDVDGSGDVNGSDDVDGSDETGESDNVDQSEQGNSEGNDGTAFPSQPVGSGVGSNNGVSSSGLHLPESLKPFEGAIEKASKASGIDPAVLAGQIYQESRGVINASSTNGGNGLTDAGLMQVNENTFKDLQTKYPDLLKSDANPNNPDDNIMAGALYMKDMKAQFNGDDGAALRAYNSGPENVNLSNLSDISKYGTGDSTYVSKVQNFAAIIKSGTGTLPA
ncbi:lytic transglycosylase domain-containing protein [Pantoea stewartii]|uniref:lytic transglycosylase domain-containing protein n=1 Tax=Pantoea stewartii TaxID=66269 RepID=UPI0019824BE7|nr:transglycosylase SLT domain-containing protein [Pantoea stewartii]